MTDRLLSGTVIFTEELRTRGIGFVEVEPHAEDGEYDRIWLARYNDGGQCEGEYIFVKRTTFPNSDRVDFYVGHNSADVCGGHPTYWSACFREGDRDAVRALVSKHWPKNE
ncbi:hypothetical protein NPS53_09630 [Pseudomonas putida]|uniref:hypothetical protein n=1 Tax=Pseudomonas putida TaxID=303 RepID=UPI0023639C1F|nr:hypothetical protein [Pseudomonas putida]MDD2139838.1 hypothetical protein [Pseudomonas putida]HDS1721761.1 hypothetical protein [Pseudomonas putida]